jgi:2-polyprenyl-6-methoxyphenol hydroxylase-like FAD-dependent oxidoreductase
MRSLSLIALSLGAALPFVDANGLPDIIYRDVAVIGGGASGAYAAVRIRDDFHKSVALIEKQNILVCLISRLRRISSLQIKVIWSKAERTNTISTSRVVWLTHMWTRRQEKRLTMGFRASSM